MADSPARVSGCSGLRRLLALSRREVLRIGGLCGLGLSLPTLLAHQARATTVPAFTFDAALAPMQAADLKSVMDRDLAQYVVPLAYRFRYTAAYNFFILRGGSLVVIAIAGIWLAERLFDFKLLPF